MQARASFLLRRNGLRTIDWPLWSPYFVSPLRHYQPRLEYRLERAKLLRDELSAEFESRKSKREKVKSQTARYQGFFDRALKKAGVQSVPFTKAD